MGFDVLVPVVRRGIGRYWKQWLLLICLSPTGGLNMREIDDLVSFLDIVCSFALMHCVSIYPTPPEKCQLNQIDAMRSRYPDRVIGWSA